ncbi:hypothetical protein BKA57DRAFT_448272 [Linnemannia elongata]|nr:hypothetical protein BKA57DRAFT_448272 [Linnemannia elongata]
MMLLLLFLLLLLSLVVVRCCGRNCFFLFFLYVYLEFSGNSGGSMLSKSRLFVFLIAATLAMSLDIIRATTFLKVLIRTSNDPLV